MGNQTKYYEEKEWTKGEIKEYLRRKAKLLHRTPRIGDLTRDKDGPKRTVIEKAFGSVESAIKAAGLKPWPKPWPQWTDQELLTHIKKWSKKHPGAVFSSTLFQGNPELPNTDTIRKRFGSIEGYLNRAGVPYEKPKSQWNKYF